MKICLLIIVLNFEIIPPVLPNNTTRTLVLFMTNLLCVVTEFVMIVTIFVMELLLQHY